MKKLLVVDDEADVRKVLKDFFEELGYSVTTASNIEEAKAALEQEKPLLALLDIRMKTDRDGIEILRWIRERNLRVKTIMVTALQTMEVIEEATNLGADAYITKPLSLDYLESTVSEKL